MICPVRMSVYKKYIVIFSQQLSDSYFIGCALCIEKGICPAKLILKIARAHQGIAVCAVKEGMEEKINRFILMIVQLFFKPIELLVL